MSPLKKMYIIVYYGVSTYQRRILYIVKVPIVHQMWKPPIISVRLDSLKCVVQKLCDYLHFHFLENANLDTHICSNFLKCV